MKSYGWLIYNGGLTAPKYMALNKLYADAAALLDIELELVANNEVYCLLQTEGASATTSNLLHKQRYSLNYSTL